jgi:hypothetical protein
VTLQEVLKAIDGLSAKDRDRLYESLRQQKIVEQEAEILASRQELKQAIANGTAKTGDIRDLIAELVGDNDASHLG